MQGGQDPYSKLFKTILLTIRLLCGRFKIFYRNWYFIYVHVMLLYSRGSIRGRGRGRGHSLGRITSDLVTYKGRAHDGDGWNKVKLLNASRHEKNDVLRALVNAYQQVQPVIPLQPLSFHKQGMNYVFYVDTRAQVSYWFKL